MEKEARNRELKEAEEKGRKETAFNTAKKLKDNGIDLDIISQSPGLSIDEINSL